MDLLAYVIDIDKLYVGLSVSRGVPDLLQCDQLFAQVNDLIFICITQDQ